MESALTTNERNRIWLAALLFIAPAIFVTFSRIDIWPFSVYDMYSRAPYGKFRSNYVVHVHTPTGTYRVMGMNSIFPLGQHCLYGCMESLSAENRHRLARYIFERCKKNPDVCFLPDSKIHSVTISRSKLFIPRFGRTIESVKDTVAEYVGEQL